MPPAPSAPVKSFKKERRRIKKKVIAVSIISSLLTLAAVCGVILFVTDGKGTDVFIREAISKSKNIKGTAQELANQVESKGGISDKASSLVSSPSAAQAPPSAPASKIQDSDTAVSADPSAAQKEEKTEGLQPSSSSQQTEKTKRKEKKDSSPSASSTLESSTNKASEK